MPSKKKPREKFRAELTSGGSETEYQRIVKAISNPKREIEDPDRDRQDQPRPAVDSPAIAKPDAPLWPMATVDSPAIVTTAIASQTIVSPTIVSVAEVKGELRIPNTVVDRLFPLLEPFEQLVYLRLFRLSHGFHKPQCNVSLAALSKHIRISKRSVQRAVDGLEFKGLVKRLAAVMGGASKGLIFEVRLPSTVDGAAIVSPAIAGKSHNKKNLKKQYLKIIAPLRDAFTGGLYEDFEAACRRRVDAAGLEWDAAVLREALER